MLLNTPSRSAFSRQTTQPTPRGASRLLSFLLFERSYTQELIRLGYRDAMRVKDELLAFAVGEPVPRLFAPEWIRRDLSTLQAPVRAPVANLQG
mgnify:CR=1 FL=1